VSVWATIFLGIIALATLTTAIMQVGLLIAASRLITRLTKLVDHAEREMAPIFVHLNAIAKDASRAAAVASAQIERIDATLADLGQRAAQAMGAFQAGLGVPAREGRAVITALKEIFRNLRRDGDGNGRRRRPRADDEDALFI
jgi:hypothetical protein